MIVRILMPGLLSLGLLSVAWADAPMQVMGDNVNVHCGPGPRFEVVCQVDEGDRVTVRRAIEGWAEIVPPSHARLWVYGELIENGNVIAARVQVRSGPGISYRPAGKLERGAKVTIEATERDWVRIAPPPSAAVWISRDYLASPSTPQPTPDPPAAASSTPATSKPPAARPAASNRPTSAATPHPAASRARPLPPPPQPDTETTVTEEEAVPTLPVALRNRRLNPDRRQGAKVVLQGAVATVRGTWNKLSGYRLVGHNAEGRVVTRCYLLGNQKQLESIVGRRASIHGRQYWVHRVRYPGVRPDRILLYPERR